MRPIQQNFYINFAMKKKKKYFLVPHFAGGLALARCFQDKYDENFIRFWT